MPPTDLSSGPFDFWLLGHPLSPHILGIQFAILSSQSRLDFVECHLPWDSLGSMWKMYMGLNTWVVKMLILYKIGTYWKTFGIWIFLNLVGHRISMIISLYLDKIKKADTSWQPILEKSWTQLEVRVVFWDDLDYTCSQHLCS